MKRFRFLLFLSSFCCLLYSCNEKSGPQTPEKLFEQYRKSVVLIRNQFYMKVSMGDEMTGYLSNAGFTLDESEAKAHPITAYGTGFFVTKDGKIATNRHVVYPVLEDKEEILASLKESMEEAFNNADSRSQALTDSITEISNYIEEHADQISPEELERLTQRKDDFQAQKEATEDNYESIDMDKLEITAVPISLSVAYDNTSVDNNDSYHPCMILGKSSTKDIDLALLQLKDKTLPSNVEKIFSFEDQNPNIKNGTSDSNEVFNINKQLTIDTKLYMIGYNYGEQMANTTKGLKVQFTQGTVSQESDDYKVLYSIPSLPGSSGSPVIDQWGNLIAINYAGIKNSQSFNYGILAKHLMGLVQNIGSGGNNTTRSASATNGANENGEVDYENKLRQFIAYETARDFDGIYNSFAPNMRRYWDLKNPTKDQLRKRYTHSWEVSSGSETNILKIKKIDAFSYDLYMDYKFVNKNNESKEVKSVVRFEFDGYGKIVETYGK